MNFYCDLLCTQFTIKVLSTVTEFSVSGYIRVRAVKAFNSGGKIMGQEILEKERTSGDTQYVAPRLQTLVEKSTVLKARKLFRTLQKFK